jgi:hypothetical protein
VSQLVEEQEEELKKRSIRTLSHVMNESGQSVCKTMCGNVGKPQRLKQKQGSLPRASRRSAAARIARTGLAMWFTDCLFEEVRLCGFQFSSL